MRPNFQNIAGENRQKRRNSTEQNRKKIQRNCPQHNLVSPNVSQPLAYLLPMRSRLQFRPSIRPNQKQRRKRKNIKPATIRNKPRREKSRTKPRQSTAPPQTQSDPLTNSAKSRAAKSRAAPASAPSRHSPAKEKTANLQTPRQSKKSVRDSGSDASKANQPANAANLHSSTNQNNSATIAPIRRRPSNQSQQKIRNELRQPHHANQECAFLDAPGMPSQACKPASR